MSWDFEKSKNRHQENWWTSYADLFLMLSVVFLLLYVLSAMRSSSQSIKNYVDIKKVSMENQDLKEQTRVYSTLKDKYMEKNASADEQKTYKQLMSKLSLLQDEAKEEKDRLIAKAEENEEKAEALNKYQQIIRNIINANVLAKAGIKRRDEKIEEKKTQLASTEHSLQLTTTELQQKNQKLEETQREVNSKKQEIENINFEINKTQSELESKIKELRNTEANNSKLASKISALKNETGQKIAALQSQNLEANEELQHSKKALGEISGQLGQVKGALGAAKGELGNLKGELGNIKGELGNAKGQLGAVKSQLESAKGQAKEIAGKLRNVERDNEKYREYVQTLERDKGDLSRDLGRAKEALEAKRNLAQRIKNALNLAGVSSQVDPKNGDVIINFGDDYFETDKSNLKPSMITTLEKFFPAYAKSLLGTKDYAGDIESVEIIGFSSPTYRGKYVDPQSLSETDRAAVNYNLDLSYRRARSIFQHITNKNKFSFPYQIELLPLIKVTGRSYLSEGAKGKDLKSGLSQEDFCAKFDCKKQQKVIIRFEIKN